MLTSSSDKQANAFLIFQQTAAMVLRVISARTHALAPKDRRLSNSNVGLFVRVVALAKCAVWSGTELASAAEGWPDCTLTGVEHY